MTAALEHHVHDFERLVEIARQGEEVVLTKDGLAVTKLTALPNPRDMPSAAELTLRRQWLEDVAKHALRASTGKPGSPTSEEIFDEIRAERC